MRDHSINVSERLARRERLTNRLDDAQASGGVIARFVVVAVDTIGCATSGCLHFALNRCHFERKDVYFSSFALRTKQPPVANRHSAA